ncbi:MAG TPA: uracil-DNA glycosylase [Planctomycetaceae bacterium]|nr:uracil-DNA glycosylase [Planctomycetaceae bacterium]
MSGTVHRELTQYLESLAAAGLTHLPRPSRRLGAPAAGAAAQPSATSVVAPPPQEPAAGSAVLPSQPAAADRPKRGLFAGEEPPIPPAALASSAPAERSTMPRDERQAKLAALAKCVAACTRCTELAETRTQTVFGVGNPQARILFIGEAPGADEDRQGEPFVGKAGQLLNKIIEACRLRREDVYICNILRCRPPGNRTPTPREAAHCREFLDGQIAIVDPDYVVCLGSCAAQNLLGTTAPIGRLRGKFYTHGRAKVLCTYHPSYLLRTPSAKKDVWDDMKLLFRDMGVEL